LERRIASGVRGTEPGVKILDIILCVLTIVL
jgi:hypothetical protein